MHSRKRILLTLYFHQHEKLRAETHALEEQFKAAKNALQKTLANPTPADQKLKAAIDAGAWQMKYIQMQYSIANKKFKASQAKYEKAKVQEQAVDQAIAKQTEANKAALKEKFLFWKETARFQKKRDDLFAAIKKGNIDPIPNLLHGSPELSKATVTLAEWKESAVTPLMFAVLSQHDQHNMLVDLFLHPDIGVDVNAATYPSWHTALHLAVMRRNLHDVAALLARNADPLVTDAKGRTPRQLLKDSKDEVSNEIRKLLVEAEELTQLKQLLFKH